MKKSLGKYFAGLVVFLVFLVFLVTPVWAEVVATNTYPVTGNTLAKVWDSIQANSPNKPWAGKAEWQLFPSKESVGRKITPIEDPSCPDGFLYNVSYTRTITWSINTTITLPKWTDGYDSACDKVQDEWDRFLEALKTHERGHDKAVEDALAKAKPLTEIVGVGSDCVKATAVATAKADLTKKSADEKQRLLKLINDADTKYDGPPPTGTNHGETQGAKLDVNVSCAWELNGDYPDEYAGTPGEIVWVEFGVHNKAEESLNFLDSGYGCTDTQGWLIRPFAVPEIIKPCEWAVFGARVAIPDDAQPGDTDVVTLSVPDPVTLSKTVIVVPECGECEPPNTEDNEYCPQTTEKCEGPIYWSRDDKGDCDANCQCKEDLWGGGYCVPPHCGAECGIYFDCPAGMICTEDCKCVSPPVCGNSVIDPGEQCDPPGGNSTQCENPTCVGPILLEYSDVDGDCIECICVPDIPISSRCAVECGAECESNADCGPGELCIGCFCVQPCVAQPILTYVDGTPMVKELDTLRDFRDEYLLTNPVGQAFVSMYYKVSPPMAEFIIEHPALKPVLRAGLVPMVAIANVATNIDLPQKMAVGSLLVLVPLLLVGIIAKNGGSPGRRKR